MHIQIKSGVLRDGINKAKSLISAGTTMPIMSNLLISAGDGNTIKITGTDLDTTLVATLDAEVIEEGAITLPSKRLAEIAKSLAASSTAEIKTIPTTTTAIITCDGARWEVCGIAHDDFPSRENVEDDFSIQLGMGKLQGLLREAGYAQSDDEIRIALCGVCFDIFNGKLNLISTDGRRLAKTYAVISEDGAARKMILPTKAISAIQRNIPASASTRIKWNDHHARIETFHEGAPASVEITTKLIDAKFPDYKQVIPDIPRKQITVDRKAMIRALKKVMIMTSDKSSGAAFERQNGEMKITANTPEVGKAECAVPIVDGDEGEIKISFNPKFMIDQLGARDEDHAVLDFGADDQQPIVGIENGGLAILMPMRKN